MTIKKSILLKTAAILAIVAFCLFAMLFLSQRTGKVKTLRISHSLDSSHPIHKSLEYFAQIVEQDSGNTLKVLVYSSCQLGSDRETVELMQMGILSMGICSAGPLESFVPEMKIFGVPYLFRDKKHMYKVLDNQIGERLLSAGGKFGIKGLCFLDAGARSFYTCNKMVNTPEDLKGMKIRVMKTNMCIKTMEAMNASPTPINFGELYTALQQGVVDGAENNPPSFYTSRHYEVCKYYSLDEHLRIPDVLLISKIVWDGLSDEDKQILLRASKLALEYQRKVWSEFEDYALEEVKKAGVEVFYPEKKDFIALVKPLWQEFEGTETGEMIKEIQAIN